MDVDAIRSRVLRFPLRVTAVLLLGLCSTCIACAAGKGTVDSAWYWYDGERKRMLWEQAGLVAQFGETAASGELAARYPNAALLSQPSAQVRLWALPGADAQQLIESMSASSRLSPVFGDLPRGGRLRALPGGIMVHFQAHWDPARIREWLLTRELTTGERLEFLDNAWWIPTLPGLPALWIANTLYETGQVRAAYPDWWEETGLR